MEIITPNSQDAQSAIRTLIRYIGEDPDREGLKGTPDRIIRMFDEIFRGYSPDKEPHITTFENDERTTDMVFDTGDFYSMCEHHILPFFGKYYFAYIPREDGRIIGISKIARVVGYCSARLQLQERLAQDIISMLEDAIEAKCSGMAIVMKGQHMCKSMRGVKNNGKMTVMHTTGLFKTDTKIRDEFFTLINMQDG
jgi:GTP cyclohydrolase I